MSGLHIGILCYDFLTGFTQAKLIDNYPELKSEFGRSCYSSKKEGKDFYHNKYDYVEGNLISEYDHGQKCFIHKDKRRLTKKEFEDFYKKEIEKKITIKLEEIRQFFIRSQKLKETNIINIREINIHNKNLKRIPSYFCSKYMDKYYVYNLGIHQIVRASRVGFNGINLIIQKPSGKLTELTLELSSFEAKRKLFMSFEESKNHLLDNLDESEIPLYKKDYINALKSYK